MRTISFSYRLRSGAGICRDRRNAVIFCCCRDPLRTDPSRSDPSYSSPDWADPDRGHSDVGGVHDHHDYLGGAVSGVFPL